MTAARISDVECEVLFNHSILQDDGSSLNTVETIYTMASVVPLQPKEIQRLLDNGITVRNGVSIVVTNVPNRRPDKIIADSKSWRILDWTFVYAYTDVDEYDEIEEEFGTIVATCDEMTIEGV
jgi:hypothetical protein